MDRPARRDSFDEYHDSHHGAARRIARLAHVLADARHIPLGGTHWRRGHEFADWDDYYLTLESGDARVSRHVPNACLDQFTRGERCGGIEALITEMLQRLAKEPISDDTLRALPQEARDSCKPKTMVSWFMAG
jgi:hypothetical protein